MTIATMMFVSDNRLTDFYFTKDPVLLANELIQDGEYARRCSVQVEVTGEDAAEEMFDLTNNPSRQEEREQKYGNGRSLSVGDVVHVDGKYFVCSKMGWEQL